VLSRVTTCQEHFAARRRGLSRAKHISRLGVEVVKCPFSTIFDIFVNVLWLHSDAVMIDFAL
jgi:hypothetical protein